MRSLPIVLLLTAACEIGLPAGAEPHRELNFLDMADQPKLKPQRPDLLGETPNGMLPPPAGTLAVGAVPYPFTQEQAELASVLVNPLAATPKNVARGEFVYENVCVTCHGPEAAGDGHLTRLFPAPPSLMTQKLRDWSDGRIFHLPMRGQGSMPKQTSVVENREAWAAILYIRSLQAKLPVAPPPANATPTAPDEAPADTPAEPAPSDTPDTPAPSDTPAPAEPAAPSDTPAPAALSATPTPAVPAPSDVAPTPETEREGDQP